MTGTPDGTPEAAVEGTTDPAASLEELRRIALAATPGPWAMTAQDGADFTGEAWSRATISSATTDIAITYLTDVIEPDAEPEVNERFIIAARTAMPRLVAAVEAGTRLADGWEKETERLDTLAGSTEDPLARAAVSMRAQAFEQCARELREAITSALTSTQSPVETVETPPTRQEAPDGR